MGSRHNKQRSFSGQIIDRIRLNMGLKARKPVFRGLRTTPAHPCSLISTFVIRFLESTVHNLPTSEISIFQLVSVADETGLSLALSETPKTGFLATWPI